MKKTVIVTTSWDDGDPLDLRLAELLRLRGLPGTFYVPIIGYLGRPTLRQGHLRNLVREGFEIGAHSYSHRSLLGMEPFELRTEVIRCRSLLEESADQHISMFCYPNGKYDSATLKSVREAGYLGARTTRMLRTDAGNDRFEIPTTVQAYPHPEVSYLKNAAKGRNYRSLLKHVLPVFTATSWIQLGMRMFDYVLAHGGVWHLYGHSWELEDYRLWNELRTLLDYVSGRDSVEYMTNGELTAFSHGRKPVALTPAA